MSMKHKVALLAGLVVTSLTASASAEYVCRVHRIPGDVGYYGDDGHVQVQLYTGPNCTGSYDGTRYFCSSGGSSSNCTSYVYGLYTGADLNALAENLSDAARTGQRVYAPAYGSSTVQGYYVYFYGD